MDREKSIYIATIVLSIFGNISYYIKLIFYNINTKDDFENSLFFGIIFPFFFLIFMISKSINIQNLAGYFPDIFLFLMRFIKNYFKF